MRKQDSAYMLESLEKLMNIDSPTGFTDRVQFWLKNELTKLGFTPCLLRKGGLYACLGGEGEPLLMLAHIDTLGAVVTQINGNGSLSLSPLGGLSPNNVETETVRVYTRAGSVYEGTIQLHNPSTHVNKDASAPRSFANIEVILDEDTRSQKETEALGICAGDIVAVNPRFTVTEKGYIKSRFLDDKASAAVLLALAKAVAEGEIALKRKVYIGFTAYEEVGHGASAGWPQDTCDMLSVDMGCVGDGLTCTEKMVSICAKDSGGPYNYAFTGELIEAAKAAGAGYAVDVYPAYGSDVEASLRAGYDVRHGLVGPGVFASHGYERTHIEGLENTFKLIEKVVGYEKV